MRALVISGGGSKGAFAGGISEYLLRDCKREYDIFVGTSTGSLLVPLLSIGEIDKLKSIYTSVNQKDVFSISPFIIKKRKGEFEMRMNHFNILKMFLKGKKTFGESKNLKKLICEIITPNDFEKMKQNRSEVVVTVSNMSLNQVEYKRLKEYSYEDYCDWIWASANMVPFMSLLEKDGFDYADGGLGNIVPIAEAIRRGACEVDVIVLKTQKPNFKKKAIKNAFELTTRVFDFMMNQIIADDIVIGKLQSKSSQVNLNFYHPPELLTKNALIFDPVMMKRWWQMGYEFGRDNSPFCRLIEIKK